MCRCGESVLFYEQPPAMSPSPKSKWHVGQSRIKEMGKCITGNTDFSTMIQAGVRVKA